MTLIPDIRKPLCLCAALAAAACGDGDGAPALETRPDSLAFDPVPVGRLSQPRVVEWANAGADTVALVELRLFGDGAGDFLVEDDACTGASLAPGGSCTAVVLFGPREPGSSAAAVAAVTGSGGTAPVPLRGQGVSDGSVSIEIAGLVRAVPETLDFGEQPVGAVGGPLGVRLVNQRTGAVQFAARVGGGAPGEYRAALDRCSNEILAAGRACTIRVLFSPAVEGMRTGELVLRDLNGTTTQTVPLIGTGIPATEDSVDEGMGPSGAMTVPLVVRPRAVEFGVQAIGSTGATRVIRVANSSAVNIVVTALRLAGDSAGEFRIVRGDCERRTLVPTRACALEVAYQPATAGPHVARVEAVTSVGVESALAVLSGTGEAR